MEQDSTRMASAAAVGPVRSGAFGFIGTRWPRAFFWTVFTQALICLIFEAYVFGRIQASSVDEPRIVPTFLTLFIFAFLYEIVLTWDALRLKNTIQVWGLCAANLAFFIYAIIQADQLGSDLGSKTSDASVKVQAAQLWSECRTFLIVIPIIIAVTTCIMALIAWKLYREFAWDILKQIGADYRMRKRLLQYQIYIALLKFDFFFFLGFTVQFLVIVSGVAAIEFGLTTAAIPVTIAILLCAAFFTQRESKAGTVCVIALYFGGLAYFFFKLVRIYQPGFSDHYMPVRKSLTAFTVLTIILIILTIINAFVCISNFGKGLKQHVVAKPVGNDVEKEDNSIQLHDHKTAATRMTID